MCQTNYETHPLPMDLECHNSKLKRLDLYLCRLPSSLAITESFSCYNFSQFSLDPDWVEAIGSVEGVVNHESFVSLDSFMARGPPYFQCLMAVFVMNFLYLFM